MDGSAFDGLSRRFATVGSRRGLLGLLIALPIASVLLGDTADARPGRKGHRHHAKPQHRHAKTQRRKDQRKDAQADACIPTGQACPSKRPRGKKGRKLGCKKCCQGSFVTEASGRTVCGCQPNGGACTSAKASACCSGSCDGSVCQIPPSAPCGDRTCAGCCQDGACQPGTSLLACGSGGAPCITCSLTHQVCQGDGRCACTVASCPDCTICSGDGTCQPVVCDDGQRCEAGACCYATPAAFQAALADPAGPQTIPLCAGTFTVPSLSDAFTITRPVRILGAGEGAGSTVLAQDGGGLVVWVQAGTDADPVRLEHLAITGGTLGVSADGNRHWAMTDCTVRDNRAGVDSQGLYNQGVLTLTRCQIRDNGPAMGSASTSGGGLRNTRTAKLTLIDCCVTGNRQQTGGGIFNESVAAFLTLTNTRVIGNDATLNGGGVLNRGSSSNITISGSTVICNNTAPSNSNCLGVANAACGAMDCPTSCNT